jgi:hypothetical protein
LCISPGRRGGTGGEAFELTKSVKGEPPVNLPDTFFVSSAADYNYDALARLAPLKGL